MKFFNTITSRVDRAKSNTLHHGVFAFDLLIEVFDHVPGQKRATQRLVSTRWRTAYWGRVESIRMRGVAPFIQVAPILYCIREVQIECALTNLPPDNNPCIVVCKLVFNKMVDIPVGALEKLFHMESVQSIDASWFPSSHPSSINDAHLVHCTSLRELDAQYNSNIRTTAPFAASLRKLRATYDCGIDDAGLVCAVHLEELDASYNPNITTTTPFVGSLRKLKAGKSCGITDSGLVSAVLLEELDASCNPRITTTAPFASALRILDASGSWSDDSPCGITDAGLVFAIHLEELYASNNPYITTTAPFSSTLRILDAGGSCGITNADLPVSALHTTGRTIFSGPVGCSPF